MNETPLTSCEAICRELNVLGILQGDYTRLAADDLIAYLKVNNAPFTGSVARQIALAMVLAHGRGALSGMAHLTAGGGE